MFFSSSPLSHTASHSIMNSKVAFAPADHLAAAALQSSDEEATFGCCWSNLPCALRRRRRRRTKKMRPTCVFYLQEGGREVAVPLESAPLDDRVVSDVLHDEPRSSETLVPVVGASQDLETVVLDASQIASAIYTGCDEAKVVGKHSSDICDERCPGTLVSLVCASEDEKKVVLDASKITPTIYTGSDEATVVGENYSNVFSVSQCKSLNSVASGQTVYYAGHNEAKSLPDQNYSIIDIIVSDISPDSDKMADMMVASNSIQSSLPCSVREMPLAETFPFAVREICKELRNYDSYINASVPRQTTPVPLPPVESDCISISHDTLPESDDNSDNNISIEKDDFAVNLGTSTDRPAKPFIEDRPSVPHPSAHESGTGEHHKVTVKDEKGLQLILPPRTDNEGSVVSASEASSYDTVHAVAQQEVLTTSQANEPNAPTELEQMCLSQPIDPNKHKIKRHNANESPRENYPQMEASLPEVLNTIASAQQVLDKTVAPVDEDTADSTHSLTAELKEKSFSKPIDPNKYKTVRDNANESPRENYLQMEASLPESLDVIAAAQQVLENPAAPGNEQKADSTHSLPVDLQDMSFGEPAERNAQEALSESEDENIADSSDSSTSSDETSCDVPASQKKKKKGMSFLTFLFSKKKMKRNKILTFFVTMLLPIWLICFIVVPQANSWDLEITPIPVVKLATQTFFTQWQYMMPITLSF